MLLVINAFPKIAPMAKFKASHMISNNIDQSGAEIFGVDINSFLTFYQTLRHPLSNVKGKSLAKKLVKSLAILLKSLMNL